MTTLGAENTYNIKYTLASEDDKLLHDIEIDDRGKHFIESADEDLATFKMDWPNNKGLCWGRITEHPQDNDYFYTVTDGTSLNITSGAVVESLEIDRLPLVGWDCWTNMDTVNNILNMLDDTYTVTIGDYSFTMIDDKAHLSENIEQFKKALSNYGSKRPGYVSDYIHPSNSVSFRIKNDRVDYKQVFPIFMKKSDYKYDITENNFLYKLQNIWVRVLLNIQSYFESSSLVNSSLNFNLDLSNRLKRDTLTIKRDEDITTIYSEIDGKNDTIIKNIFITTVTGIRFTNFASLEYLEQTGIKDSYFGNRFDFVQSDTAKSIKYIIPKDISTGQIENNYFSSVKAEQITIDRIGGLPETSFVFSSYIKLLKEITLTNITEIGNDSFANLPNSVTKIELPNTLLRIGDYCFTASYDVKDTFSITVPESVTEIGQHAFIYVPKIYYKGTATGAPWGAKEVITEF